MELTVEQADAVNKRPEAILDLVDPRTNRHYALMSREVLERLQEDADDARHARGWQQAVQKGMALGLGDDS